MWQIDVESSTAKAQERETRRVESEREEREAKSKMQLQRRAGNSTKQDNNAKIRGEKRGEREMGSGAESEMEE